MSKRDKLSSYALKILNYYRHMQNNHNPNPEVQEPVLIAAERYVTLVQSNETTVNELKEFLNYIKEKENEIEGAALVDFRGGASWLIKQLESET